MKGKIALLMATVMAVTSFSAVTMAASGNSVKGIVREMEADEILTSDVDNRNIELLNSQEGIDSIANGNPVRLEVKPYAEVYPWEYPILGESILIFIENGKFDKRLTESDPFIFRTKESGLTYDEIVSHGRDYEENLKTFVGGEGSRELPYRFNYINEDVIEVYLYPINDDKTNKYNEDITQGVPIYNIALPITTEGSSAGFVDIRVDSNDSAMSGGTYSVAGVYEGATGPVWGGYGSSNSLSVSGIETGKDKILISGLENNSIEILNSDDGIDSLVSGEAVYLNIRPLREIEEDSTITLIAENCKFDKRLTEVSPFKFKTKYSGVGYKEIME